MTQITANLMEKTLQLTVQGNSPCFRWFNKETLWPLRSLEDFFPQITKFTLGGAIDISVASIFTTLESISTEPLSETSKNISQYFKRSHLIILLSNHEI